MWGFGFAANVEEVYAHEDDDKATEEGECVDRVGGVESLEENGGSDNGCGREKDIVNGVNDVGGEGIECAVEVVLLSEGMLEVYHLDEDTADDNSTKDICADVGELVLARQRELQSDSKAFDRHDRHTADQRADREVDHRVGLAVLWNDANDHER